MSEGDLPDDHPLDIYRLPIGAAAMDAIDGLAGLSRPPRTPAELDQHAKACDDVERYVRWLVQEEREAAALAVHEAAKW